MLVPLSLVFSCVCSLVSRKPLVVKLLIIFCIVCTNRCDVHNTCLRCGIWSCVFALICWIQHVHLHPRSIKKPSFVLPWHTHISQVLIAAHIMQTLFFVSYRFISFIWNHRYLHRHRSLTLKMTPGSQRLMTRFRKKRSPSCRLSGRASVEIPFLGGS